MRSVFNKVAGLLLYEKEIPTQKFSCDYCKIFKNVFIQNTSGRYFWLQQVMEDIPRNNCFKIPRKICLAIQFL